MIEFLEPNTEDWMAFGLYQGPLGPVPSAPASWHRLSWHTDHMRRRASGMRPTEGDMFEEDRVAYSRHVRRHFRAAGIEAMPWCVPEAATPGLEEVTDDATSQSSSNDSKND